MKVPGRAWLQFEAATSSEGETVLTQTAYFAPKGLFGLLYWYVLYPMHGLIFQGMIDAIGARTLALADLADKTEPEEQPVGHP